MRIPKGREILAAVPALLDKALAVQEPVVRAHVERLKKANPGNTPHDVVAALERQYLAVVTSMGAASGAAAAAPAVGTAVALPINVAEVGGFLEATTLFVLALAHIHGVEIEDLERRRTVVLAVLAGNRGTKIVEKIAGRIGPHWARAIVKGIPMESIRAINKVLGRNFVTKQGTKQGILVLGRELPLGIGFVFGGIGNAALGYMAVRAARSAFGTPPAKWQPPQPASDPVGPRPTIAPAGTGGSDALE